MLLTNCCNHLLTGPADAIAELIDNSIQHCDGPSRLISISLHISSPSFIVVADNGSGMTVEDIKAFATFALDRRTRNIAPVDESDPRYISKFGVGAKQAGFYLGTNISIVTKPRAQGRVLNFTMDEKAFEERYHNQTNVYSDTVHNYSSTEEYEERMSKSLNWSHTVWEAVHEHSASSGFTAVVIELRDEIDASLGGYYDFLELDLADIYYFHLHPQCLLFSKSPVGSVPQMHFRVFHDLNQTLNNLLNDNVDCRTHQYFSRKKDHFLFQIDLPDPTAMARQPTGVSSQIVHIERRTAHGIIAYYPYIDTHETHPDHDPELNQDREDSIGSAFHVYWQCRLVPQSKWTALPFFADLIKGKSPKAGIAEHWQQRIQGFLFFDWTFDHISNNKLKLLVAPDFNTWINSKEVQEKSLLTPKDAGKRFTEFMKKCAFLDREFEFSGRVRREGAGYEDDHSYFEKVRYNRQPAVDFKAGDKVKWKDGKDKFEISGQVVDFVVDRQLPPGQDNFCGTGSFRYLLLPEDIMGKAQCTETLATLCHAENIATCRYSDQDDDRFRQQLPVSIHVARQVAEADPAIFDIIDQRSEYVAGAASYNLYFQLIDADGHPTLSLPFRGNNKKDRYEVQLVLKDEDGDAADLGRQKSVYELNKEEETTVRGNNIADVYYKFKNVKITMPGEHKLVVKVLTKVNGKDTAVFDATLLLTVISLVPSSLQLLDNPFARPIQLGNALPPFTLVLEDSGRGRALYAGTVKVTASADSDRLRIVAKPSWNGSKDISADDSGAIAFDEGDWTVEVIPSDEGEPVVRPKGNKLSVQFEVSLASGEITSTQHHKANSLRRSVDLTILPGLPGRFALLEPDSTIITVRHGGSLPKLKLVLLDQWGNHCAPKNDQKWQVTLQGEGMVAAMQVDMRTGNDEVRLPLTWSNDAQTMDSSQCDQPYQLLLVSNDPDIAQLVQPFSLRFVIVQSRLPTKLQILHNGLPLGNEVEATAGSVLTNLSFQLLDSRDRVMTDIADLLEGHKSHMEYTWAQVRRGKRKKEQISLDCALQDIKVPKKAEPSEQYELDVTIGDIDLSCTFVISVQPGAPHGLKILHAIGLDEGLRVQDSSDLHSKLLGLCCVDEHDNILSILPQHIVGSAEIILNAEDSEQGGMQVLELAVGSVEGGLISEDLTGRHFQAYTLLPEAALSNIFHPNSRVRISASAGDTFLREAEPLIAVVVAGTPCKLLLSSNALRIPDPSERHVVQVAHFTQFDDITLLLVDSTGVPASLADLQDISLKVSKDGEQVAYRPEQLSAAKCCFALTPDLKTLFARSESDMEVEEERSAVLRFSVSFRMKGELHRLPDVLLTCRAVRCDDVTEIKVDFLMQPSQQGGLAVGRESSKYTMQLVAGTAFPDLQLTAVTDNGAPLKHCLKDFKFKFKAADNKKLQFADIFTSTLTEGDAELLVVPNESAHAESLRHRAGESELRITYYEGRSEYADLPKDLKEHSLRLRIAVVAAEPAKLFAASGEELENSVVTNASNDALRSILKKLKMELHDAFGNVCELDDDANLFCEVCSSGEKPVLEGADGNGRLSAVRKAHRFEFDRITVAKETRCPTGSYCLRFVFSSSMLQLEHTIDFQYASQEQFSTEKSNLVNELRRLKADHSRYNELNERAKQLKKHRREQLEQVSSAVRESVDDLDALRSLRSNRLSQLGHLQRRCTAPRAANKRAAPDPVLVASSGGLGMVVDLAFVNDVNEARILSFHAHKYMDAWVVPTATVSQQLFAKGVKAWALDLVKPFVMTTRSNTAATRERTTEEREAGMLPLPAVTIGKEAAPGNPQYMVNLLKLDEDNEHLRDSIFFSIFNTSILFDTMAHATQYRKYRIEQKLTCAVLYSRKGERLDSNGLLDPRDRLPERQDYVFGEQPMHSTREYAQELQQTERERDALEAIIEDNEQLALVLRERDALMDPKRRQQRMQAVTAELKKISFALGGEGVISQVTQDDIEEDDEDD